jgi:hypothetical protein
MAGGRSSLHTGQVNSHNNKAAAAKVAMDDFDGMVSGHMQMLFPASGHWNFFWIPKEGDHVVTERNPNGAQEGYIMGKPYTANNMPQGGDDGLFLMVSSDGKNVIKLDAIKGTMDIVCDQKTVLMTKDIDIEVTETANIKSKNINIENTENIKIENTGDADIEVGGNVAVKVDGDETVEVGGDILIKTDGAASFKATGSGLIETGNAVATLGGIMEELMTALTNLQTEGSPALHKAATWATANITPLKAKCAQVFKK